METVCRPGCGACCIAPSISSVIPGMSGGKPAGARCVQLTVDNRCQLFESPCRPAVCGGLKPSLEMCGNDREHAMRWLLKLEQDTTST
ncbi:YkgJ family cysteine cluster protein [Chitinivorax sp. B]|uniref:YkgJ family cysteine cluster protein n=1 Tax=Chitinivorax sp. B TaxID=2502235 RepID=UPI0010F62E94|nr:YkgJ family cysteine cluster protein [Chitinivorax sp. B]